jgi:hypothetical protein
LGGFPFDFLFNVGSVGSVGTVSTVGSAASGSADVAIHALLFICPSWLAGYNGMRFGKNCSLIPWCPSFFCFQFSYIG